MRHVKLIASATVVVVTGTLVLAAPVAAQQNGADLVAPVYPAAIPVPHVDDSADLLRDWNLEDDGYVFKDNTRSFLSKDRIDKVRAYYDAEIGEMQNASLTYLRVPEGMRSETMRPGAYVYARQIGRNENSELTGVELRALEPEDAHPGQYRAVGPIFEKLQVGQVSGQATKQQYDDVVNEYKYLASMFYPLTEERSERGRRLSADEVVVNGCQQDAGGGMSPEELEAKMKQLMAEGKMQEMQKLAQNMSGASGMDTWDTWVGCLKKLEAQGYKTLITIHIQP